MPEVKVMNYPFSVQWPKDSLFANAYVHDILTYRYNWHTTEYEIDIVLKGKAEYSSGGKLYTLGEDDLILVNPSVGHASLAKDENTLALVLRFSLSAFRSYLKPRTMYRFSCCSDQNSRSDTGFRRIRFYAAQFIKALFEDNMYSLLTAKGALELLLSSLCGFFPPEIIPAPGKEDESHREALQNIIKYIDVNYASKISLEELAKFSQYNRTYISTIFKDGIGMNFYDYLKGVRFQHANYELVSTRKNLTDIALDNGFPELKLYNSYFREIFHCTPAAYRENTGAGKIPLRYDQQNFYGIDNADVRKKLNEYLYL
jgi:AraC-like DNA-binding protein